MSDRTPQHQPSIPSTPRMLAVAVLAVLAVAAAVLLTGCDPTTGRDRSPRPASVDTSTDDDNVKFSASCDETGFAYDVRPNTPAAHQAARRMCRNMTDSINNAPWPEGVHPLGGGQVSGR